MASRAWLLGIHSIGTWAGRRAEQRVQRGSRQRFSSGHLLGACLPYRCCQSAPDKSSSCQWLPRSGGSRPEIWGYKLLEASPLRRVSASFCPFSLPKGPKPPTTSKKGNDSRRSPRLIWQPPRKYPCSHTPIGRVFGLARSLGLRTFPALCRIGVSVSKSDVNPGAGPARKKERRPPFGSRWLCRRSPVSPLLGVCSVVPPRQHMATWMTCLPNGMPVAVRLGCSLARI